MRVLVTRILTDLIAPCRKRLEDAEKNKDRGLSAAETQRDAALQAAQAKRSETVNNVKRDFSRAENAYRAALEDLKAEYHRKEARVKAAIAITIQLPNEAKSLLGKKALQMAAQEDSSSVVITTDAEIDTRLAEIETFDKRFKELFYSRKPIYWPKETGWRWAIVIVSAILLLIFPPLVLTWVALVFIWQLFWEKAIQGQYCRVVNLCSRNHIMLKPLLGQLQTAFDTAVKSLEDSRLMPAKLICSAGLDAAEDECTRMTTQANSEFEREAQCVIDKHDSEVLEIATYFGNCANALHKETETLKQMSLYAGDDWHSKNWENWFPDPSPEFAARIGTLSIEAPDLKQKLPTITFDFCLPALIPFVEGRCLLLEAKGRAKDIAGKAVQSVMLRMLANTPPGKLRFTFIDPVGLGQNVADYMSLADHEEALISGRAWTEPRHIETRLSELSDHMETVIQKYLRNDFPSITEYNKEAQDVAEPFRFLIIFDFPVNFSDDAVRRLVSIVKNGPRCGVFTLIVRDVNAPVPHKFNVADLETCATRIVESTDNVISSDRAQNEATEPNITFDVRIKPVPVGARENVSVALSEINSGLSHEQATLRLLQEKEIVVRGLSSAEAEQAMKKLRDAGAASSIKIAMPEDRASSEGFQAEHFVWDEAGMKECTLMLDQPPPKPLLKFIVSESGSEAKSKMKVEVPYEKLLALAELNESKWWRGSTASSLKIPIGPAGAGKLQYLVMGEGLGHHGLIVGRPGSGKSNLMHVIITTLALFYPPDEIQFYLIDFKKGVEFKAYADHKLPHALTIAVESEREFGLSVIQRLDNELKERGDRFRAAGVANISEFRKKSSNVRTPRVLLLIDEFQELFAEDDAVAREAALLLDRLVRQGRAFGLHVLLGSQTLGGAQNLPRTTIDQMGIRIAMQCSETDSHLVLASDNAAARMLSRPGEAIYNASTGTIEGNSLFQVALFKDEDRQKCLETISRLARERGVLARPIVFEGNELAKVDECAFLNGLINLTTWPVQSTSIDLLLGEAIAIRPPVTARIRRQSGRNLMIVSRDESEGACASLLVILSILLQHLPDRVRIIVADFSSPDSEGRDQIEAIRRSFSATFRIVNLQREVASMLSEIEQELRIRSDKPERRESIYLVLRGMHRIKSLREDGDDEDGHNAVELFSAILRDGPELGVHVIAWADTWANATRGIGRKRFGEFGLRTGGVMSAEDSMNVFDSPIASRLSKPHRMIFSDEDRPGQFLTFRPYAMPTVPWIEKLAVRLQSRPKESI